MDLVTDSSNFSLFGSYVGPANRTGFVGLLSDAIHSMFTEPTLRIRAGLFRLRIRENDLNFSRGSTFVMRISFFPTSTETLGTKVPFRSLIPYNVAKLNSGMKRETGEDQNYDRQTYF